MQIYCIEYKFKFLFIKYFSLSSNISYLIQIYSTEYISLNVKYLFTEYKYIFIDHKNKYLLKISSYTAAHKPNL